MNDWLKKLDQIFTDLFLKKAPGLPEKAKEGIVKVTPWLALVFGVMAIPGILAVLGFGAVAAPFWALKGVRSLGYLVALAIGIVQIVTELVAVPHLFKKAKRGWNLLYWGTLLSVVSALLHFSGFGIVFAGLTLYLLYQIKAFYK